MPREFIRPGAGQGAVLVAEELQKSFGGVRAVRDVSFAVADRTLHALIGPNGAGKTTAFNLLSGMFVPDHGRVLLDGRQIGGLEPHAITRAGVGRSFQITNLFPGLTIEENVRLAIQARHVERFSPWRDARQARGRPMPDHALIPYPPVGDDSRVASPPARPPTPEDEARFRLLAETVPSIIWTAAPDGTITWVNQRWLDFVGRIPPADATRAFLADPDPDKRTKLIDRLLTGPDYAPRMADAFHVMLMERLGDHPEWTAYLTRSFEANKPWDRMYSATGTGTRCSIEAPRLTASRTAVADTSTGRMSRRMAPAGTVTSAVPGRGTTTTCANRVNSPDSRHRGRSRAASAPSIKNNRSSGCSAFISRNVSTV